MSGTEERIRRIAMWSGPRNISTAMMRSWGSRPDTFVWDEPLYAFYLDRTGLPHPARDEVLASQPTDWRQAVDRLLDRPPDGKTISYQKHMSHHLLPEVERDWLDVLDHAFLIRDPQEMLRSLDFKLQNVTLSDTGLPQQVELFERIAARDGSPPPVVDARDVLNDPEGLLSALCARLDVPFDRAMLSWEPGLRDTDGVWAPYWYENVALSTSFQPHRPPQGEIPDRVRGLLAECRDLYERLAAYRLGA